MIFVYILDIGRLIGNNNHDVVTTSQPINFGVADASHHLANKLGIHTVEESIDVTLVSENENVPQSSLHFYLQRLLNEPNIAALVIINAFTISFVARENKFIVMDSHCLIVMAGMEL